MRAGYFVPSLIPFRPDFRVVSLHKGAFLNVTDTFRTNIYFTYATS